MKMFGKSVEKTYLSMSQHLNNSNLEAQPWGFSNIKSPQRTPCLQKILSFTTYQTTGNVYPTWTIKLTAFSKK